MTEEEVKVLLESWLANNIDSHEWDNFISVKAKSSKLESIRRECESMWVQGSPYIENSQRISLTLSESGKEKIRGLIAELQNAT